MRSLGILSDVLQACPAKMLGLFTIRSWQPPLMIWSAVGITRWRSGDVRKEGFVPQPWESLFLTSVLGTDPSLFTPQQRWGGMGWDYSHRWHGIGVYVLIPGQARLDVSKIAVEVLLPLDFWHFWSSIRVGFCAWSITQSQQLCSAAAAMEPCWCQTGAASWRQSSSYFLLFVFSTVKFW